MSEQDKLQEEKVKAEIKKLLAESDKLMSETRWYPTVVTAALFAAIGTFFKLLSPILQ